MLRRIARRGIPALAALLGLLAAFITPPGHAAAAYDISQVGNVDSFSFTDMQGRAINGTDTDGTAIADGVELADPHTKLAVRATISDLDKLDAGDRISIPVDLTGHFGFVYATWGSTVDVDGRTIATVSGSPTPTLTLTDAVKAFTTVSFTLNANTYASIITSIPLSDIERMSCGLSGNESPVKDCFVPGHVLTREESIWLQPFASWS